MTTHDNTACQSIINYRDTGQWHNDGKFGTPGRKSIKPISVDLVMSFIVYFSWLASLAEIVENIINELILYRAKI